MMIQITPLLSIPVLVALSTQPIPPINANSLSTIINYSTSSSKKPTTKSQQEYPNTTYPLIYIKN
jgi:hypothetical protein